MLNCEYTLNWKHKIEEIGRSCLEILWERNLVSNR